jgi:hypothetical protein
MINRGPAYWFGFIIGRGIMVGSALWLINKARTIVTSIKSKTE